MCGWNMVHTSDSDAATAAATAAGTDCCMPLCPTALPQRLFKRPLRTASRLGVRQQPIALAPCPITAAAMSAKHDQDVRQLTK
jgi:hypothetical protein